MRNQVKRWLVCLLSAAMLCAAACTDDVPQGHVDLSDPVGGDGIYTPAELIGFIASGASDTASLGGSIDLGDEILKLTAARGPITIKGNGFAITGNADCVIRLEDGCTLRLEDVTITGGRSAIGCLGDAEIGGEAIINSIAHGIRCEGALTVSAGSNIAIESSVGSGVQARAMAMERGAALTASGGLGGVNVTKDDLVLAEDALLAAATAENYNALKCEGDVHMREGATLRVTNEGDYHGAEIGGLSVEGLVTIEAVGGEKGVGVFLFQQEEDIYVLGSCAPELRFEVGDGSVTFVESAEDIPEPEPTDVPAGDDAAAGTP